MSDHAKSDPGAVRMSAPTALAPGSSVGVSHRRIAWSIAIDAVAVLVFVAIGRHSHDESGNAITGTLSVAAPFLIALAIGWLVGCVWQRPTSVRSGVIVSITTVALGLVLRRFMFDRGTAPAFVVVATISLAVLVIGWRLATRQLHRAIALRRATHRSATHQRATNERDGEVGDPARR